MRKNLLLFFIAFLFCLFLVELFFKVINKPQLTLQYAGWKSIIDDCVNELGYRGKRFSYTEEDFVILLIGDSQIETIYTSCDSMPESLLQNSLSNFNKGSNTFKVFSIGASGYGNDQQLLALEEYYRSGFRSDLVIYWQTFENDVWNNTWPTHWPKDGTIKPTFHLDDDELNGPNYSIGDTLIKPSGLKIGVIFQRLINPSNGLDEFWANNYLPPAYKPFPTNLWNVDSIYDVTLDEKFINESLNTEKSHLSVHLTPVSKRTTYGLELTKKIITNMQSVVRESGSEFLILDAFPQDKINSLDTIALIKNENIYYVSNRTLNVNKEFVNSTFDVFPFKVKDVNYFVSKNDSHFNVKVINDISVSLANYILEEYSLENWND